MSLDLKPKPGLFPVWNNNPMAIPPPVGAWVMNEGGADTVYDSSGNGNNGSLDAPISWISGSMGRGLDIPEDNHITVGRSSSIEPQQITLEAWIIYDSFTTNNTLWSKSHTSYSDPYYSYQFRYDSNGHLLFIVVPAAYADRNECYIEYTLQIGQLYHLIGTFDGTVTRIYVDSVEVGNVVKAVTIAYHATDLWIGEELNKATYFTTDGKLFLARLYDCALTSSQIAYIHQHPYYAWEYPELWEYYAAAAVGGPTMPVFDYYYNQARL